MSSVTSSVSDAEMTSLYSLIHRCSREQINALGEALKRRYSFLNAMAKVNLSVGTRVRWNGRNGEQTGFVQKIKQKYVEVRVEGFGVWNVPASMLTVVP